MTSQSQGYLIDTAPIYGGVSALQNGKVIAQSNGAKIMRETRLRPCYYFPKSAVDENLISPSEHHTFCPFKGTASYWDIKTPQGKVKNGAWSYETPLNESKDIAGMISFSSEVIDDYQFDNQPKELPAKSDYISNALSDWILREAGSCQSRQELVEMFGKKLIESGVAVSRINVNIWSLHPEIAGVNYLWTRDSDEVKIYEPKYESLTSPIYLNSPVHHVTQGLGGVRQPLTGDASAFEYPIMEELKAEGHTDYVAMPLHFSDGQIQSMTMTSDHPDGFTTQNLGMIFECSGVLSRYFEVLTLRKNTATLMDTYLGKRTGKKVLSGDIRRGQGEDIQAVILFSDLRNSTAMAEQLPRTKYLELLNRYFETVLTPLGNHGGEVLKFIGDAVLAIFPVSSDNSDRTKQAISALLAAQDAVGSLKDQAPDESPKIDLGISLHIGDVTYGNVGGQERLDFTVIGPAVNLAARLESLCKTSGKKILMSKQFQAAIKLHKPSNTQSMGVHEFDGIAGPQEVFALARFGATENAI